MTAKEKIVQSLKEAGYNQRQVSVSSRKLTYDRGVTVTIRDVSVDYMKVKALSSPNETIHYDQATHEILLGGNTYVDVEITKEVRKTWAQNYLEKVTTALSKLKGDDYGVNIDERFTVFTHDGNMNYLKVWDKNHSWLDMNYRSSDAETLALDLFIENQKP